MAIETAETKNNLENTIKEVISIFSSYLESTG